MNSSDRRKNVSSKWFVLLVLLAATAIALAQNKEEKRTPAPRAQASHPSAPSHTARQMHGSTTRGVGSHGPTTVRGTHANDGGITHGTTTSGASSHGPTTVGGTHANDGGITRGTTTSGTGRHGPTTGGTAMHGPTTGGIGNHGPTTIGGTHSNDGGITRGTTSSDAGRHGPTTGGTAMHGPTTSGVGSHGPTTVGGTHATDGGITHGTTMGHTAMAGHTMSSHALPGRSVALRGGGSANIRPNGQVRSVNRNGMHIEHGIHGGRTVVSVHNGTRIVTTGRNGGYVQRAYVVRGGHSYYSRTYYYHGVYRTGVYRGYFWHGHPYYGYYPGYWYHPAFYGWGFHPWRTPVYWSVGAWGWRGSPWFGFYGGYFAPYPYYSSPAFWLTDYVIAANLQAAYAARQEENAEVAAAAGPPPDNGGGRPNAVVLTPEVKQAIVDEVKAELAAQQAAAGQSTSSGQAPVPADEVPPALDPARRTFVVDGNLTVVANGQECGLTAGDVLMRLTDAPDADNMVNASVSASQKSDCAAGQTVAVKVDDLQEMQNHFAEQLNSGLGELAKKQGTGGIPKAPDTSGTASDVPPPPPDTTAAKTLQDQQAAADHTDSQVTQETAGSSDAQ